MAREPFCIEKPDNRVKYQEFCQPKNQPIPEGQNRSASHSSRAKWGHSPKSWGNGGNIPLFPGLGECVGMGGMAILPLK
eukprot:COSAG06_NODE_5261_length_3601_cov_3.816729_6_plen_79_part_00